jgi:GntR family transcriptional regulator, rspAB operon transcriptional repressor
MNETALDLLAATHFRAKAPVSVGAQLHRALREAIIRGELRPGQQLSETETAQRFAISRQPVREAFIKLGEEDLVEIRPQRGTYVRKISVRGVLDARHLREIIEVSFVRQVAGKRDEALIAALRDNIERQRKIAGGDSRGFWPLDEELHRTVALAAAGEYGWRVLENIKAHLDRVRFLTYDSTTPIAQIVDEHAAIVNAIESGKPGEAVRITEKHLREIIRTLPVVARQHPEYFEDV